MGKDYLIRNIPDNLHARAKIQATLEQTTLRVIILRALAEYLGMDYKQEKEGGK